MASITQFIALILPTIALAVGIYQFFKAEEFRRISQFANKAMDIAYTPLSPLFEKVIFRVISKNNAYEVQNNLNALITAIQKNKLETYLHEGTLIDLNSVVLSIQSKNFKKANNQLYLASKHYWKLVNKYRAAVGMPKRGFHYRRYKGWYTNKDVVLRYIQIIIGVICCLVFISVVDYLLYYHVFRGYLPQYP